MPTVNRKHRTYIHFIWACKITKFAWKKINKDFILTLLNSITYSKFCSETLLLANVFSSYFLGFIKESKAHYSHFKYTPRYQSCL